MLKIILALLYGVLVASVYAIYASGFSLAFSITRVPNLAYGALYTFSAYFAYWLLSLGINVFLSYVLAIVATSLLSLLIGRFIIRPSLKNPITIFISTLAIAYIIEEVIRIRFTKFPRTLIGVPGSITIFGSGVPLQWFVVLGSSTVVGTILIFLLRKTRLGLSIRAVAESWKDAQMFGVNPSRTFDFTMMLSGILAGFTALVLSPLWSITPSMGWLYLFTAFAIVVLGGIGSIEGLFISAIIYGVSEQIVTFYFSPSLANVVPLVIVILVLVFKPHGLFGRGE